MKRARSKGTIISSVVPPSYYRSLIEVAAREGLTKQNGSLSVSKAVRVVLHRGLQASGYEVPEREER